jgi:hypothetical protein
MGGTMIAVCNAVPFVIGLVIGTISICLMYMSSEIAIRWFILFALSFLSVVPLIIPAAQDSYELYNIKNLP